MAQRLLIYGHLQPIHKVTTMAITAHPSNNPAGRKGAMFLGTGLAFASLILVPALATRLGMGMAMTGALRIALMRASNRVVNNSNGDGETDTASMCCH